ncbi:MAG TPA: hypothetical protein VF003_18970 [Pseudonocardiaceae bacterium]
MIIGKLTRQLRPACPFSRLGGTWKSGLTVQWPGTPMPDGRVPVWTVDRFFFAWVQFWFSAART